MDLKGQRFAVDFSDDDDDDDTTATAPALKSSVPSSEPAFGLSAFIGNIKERSPTAPPSAPTLKTTATGFPEHKKRARVSVFKQQRGAAEQPIAPSSDSHNAAGGLRSTKPPPLPTNPSRLTQNRSSISDQERKQIDDENNARLAAMSTEEIDQERQELLAGLNPSLIERLLKRANLDQGRGETDFESLPSASEIEEREKVPAPAPSVEEDRPTPVPIPSGKLVTASRSVRFEEDEPAEPIDLRPATEPFNGIPADGLVQPNIHFPTAPAAPELDPSDPSFFEELHKKYFPSLPADPSKLAWMAPVPTQGSLADQESSYYPGQEALAAPALRFDFRGGLLPPRIARAMPTNKGLHHHGDAPEAAGYTIPELARLARSAFPAQRCIAFQSLGRILYRLGKGVFGAPDSEMVKGLWHCVESGKVIETLEEAASAEGGHQGSKTYAVEAVWLWQKGGGKTFKAA